MAKKKSISAGDITEKDIHFLYEGVLPLLYLNPEELDPVNKLARLVKHFVESNFICYFLDDVTPTAIKGPYVTLISKMPEFSNVRKDGSQISITNLPSPDPDASFEKSMKRVYQTVLRNRRADFPDQSEYHYYQIVSRTDPKIFVGFFRTKNPSEDNSFSKNEKDIYKKLSPHIFLILRTVLSTSYKTQSFQYFDAFTKICTGIAHQYKLSESETKLLPEILFGYSNEQIADKHFISIVTVKKHIQHIFKKTGVKSRIDFIGKFFTSPERIEL